MENAGLNQISCTFECNWGSVSPKKLQKACKITEVDAGSEDIDIDSLTSLETCVCLARDESLDPPEMTVTTDGFITRMDFVSEAKIIEVFRGGGEYLTTCHSEFVDDWEDMAVYYTKCIVRAPERSLTFRFSRMKYLDRMWIYGVRLQVVPFSAEVAAASVNVIPEDSKLAFTSIQAPISGLTKTLEDMILQRQAKSSENIAAAGHGIKCQNCEKMEERLNARLKQMEEKILSEIRNQNETLLENIKALLQ